MSIGERKTACSIQCQLFLLSKFPGDYKCETTKSDGLTGPSVDRIVAVRSAVNVTIDVSTEYPALNAQVVFTCIAIGGTKLFIDELVGYEDLLLTVMYG